MVFRETLFRPTGAFRAIFLLPWWYAHQLVVDKNQITLYRGVFSKAQRTIPVDRVQDVTVTQSFFGQMFDYGNIRIETAGGSGTEIVFRNLGNMSKLRSYIDKFIR